MLRQVRADFDATTIVVYQAFPHAIVDAALAAGRFVAPFSFARMTWIKPSLLWLAHRSNWARKPGQERVLAVRVTRVGWDGALAEAVLTAPVPRIHGTGAAWDDAFARAPVHVQWDPERSLRGAALNHYSIQVGIGRERIREYTSDWVCGLVDLTPIVHRIGDLLRTGQSAKAQRLLPPERPYPLAPATAHRLDADNA